MENKDKNNVYYRLLLITAIIIPVIIGFSYAYFLAVVQGTEDPATIQGTVIDDLIFDLQTENNGYINATGIFPLNQDEVDANASRGTFKVVTGDNAYGVTYTLSLTDISLPAELKNQYFKWRLVCTSCIDTSKNAEGNFANATTELTLKTDNLIAPNSSDTYDLLIWLDNASNVDQTSAMNKSFSAKVQATAEFTNDKTIVTFDANGGTTPLSSKLVTYGQSYGELPIPTKPGYKFLGWNGKNMINDNNIKNYNNWNYNLVSNGDYPTRNSNPGYLINLEIGKIYTISYTTQGVSSDEIPRYLYLCKIVNDEGNIVSFLTKTQIINLNSTFTVAAGEEYFLRIGSSNNENEFNTNFGKVTTIQLEEGTVATEYEPYYITSDTTVVQKQNHTLKAIWEPNS